MKEGFFHNQILAMLIYSFGSNTILHSDFFFNSMVPFRAYLIFTLKCQDNDTVCKHQQQQWC